MHLKRFRVTLLALALGATGATAQTNPSNPSGGAVLNRPQPPAAAPAPAPAPPRVDQVQASDMPTGTTSTSQGVSANEIRFGMAGPFSGAAKDSGHGLQVGVDTAFRKQNDAGGVNGRMLKLIAADDGYEPARTIEVMKRLWDDDKVFGFVCNFGTPTSAVAVPFALEHKAIFFGAFTGSPLLRRDPPDRYVFNYRPGYGEETEAVLRYLATVKRLRPENIAVFAQDDAFGDAGYAGVERGARRIFGPRSADIPRFNYKRNTVDVNDAVQQSSRRKGLRAVIMVATYRAAAKFVERTKDTIPGLIYTDVSGVGSTSLRDELMLLGPKYASGVIVTQIVPAVDSYASAIIDYKSALAKYYAGEKPDYVSLEGYVVANLLIEGLKQAGPQLDTEKLVAALETLRNVDMGLGTVLGFGRTEHQASHKIWGTILDASGIYQPLDLE